MSRMADLTAALGGRIAFGGDYNPEQWPAPVWREDVELMQAAGVNLVTVGVFAWALLEPEPGRYDFTLFDEVVDLLHGAGIAVDMATGTASPPPWFSAAYPDTLLVDENGVRRAFGGRQSYCPSSLRYRAAANALAGAVAAHYADHPAVVMWHANNEYGCHNWHCFCDVSADAFRAWLRARYDSMDSLNEAWGTAFWSQRYTDWAQIGPPSTPAYRTFRNPTQQLDWWRFSSDELLTCYQGEVEAIRSASDRPITTNFMSFFKPVDYRRWATEVDLVSNDHYLLADDPDPAEQLAMSADLMRSLAGGASWLLMEHSTSAVNWQARNAAKAPGQLIRNSLQHVARGADGALFFQWRASRAGAEKFHSGLVPHAGTDTKVWRDVVELGRVLGAIAEVSGSAVEPAQAAIVFDWQSWWAAELDAHPSIDVDPLAEARGWYAALRDRHVVCDVVGPQDPLEQYRMVIVPAQYLMDDAAAASLEASARAGAHVVVTWFSGIADEHDHIRLGGYPGAVRDLLGVQIEEFFPLLTGETVALSSGRTGRIWSELGRADTAEVLDTYASGPVAGSPVLTRRDVGAGAAWYVGTSLDAAGRAEVLGGVLADAGVRPVVDVVPDGVEAVRRVRDSTGYLFLINHGGVDVEVHAAGRDLVTGRDHARSTPVPAGGVAVLRHPR